MDCLLDCSAERWWTRSRKLSMGALCALLLAVPAMSAGTNAAAGRQLQEALLCDLAVLSANVDADCCGSGHRRLQIGSCAGVPQTCSLECAATFIHFMNACASTL